MNNYLIYILIMAGVTYLIRMVPLVSVKKKIKSRFVQSFLYYVPYAVLSAMTVPAIFTSTGSTISAIIGFAVATLLAFFGKSLLTVALSACTGVLACEIITMLIK